ncbi:hypothetical protein AAC387_Pa11g0149 [Persea americana]
MMATASEVERQNHGMGDFHLVYGSQVTGVKSPRKPPTQYKLPTRKGAHMLCPTLYHVFMIELLSPKRRLLNRAYHRNQENLLSSPKRPDDNLRLSSTRFSIHKSLFSSFNTPRLRWPFVLDFILVTGPSVDCRQSVESIAFPSSLDLFGMQHPVPGSTDGLMS